MTHVKQEYPDFLFQANHKNLVNDLIVALAKSLELLGRSENQVKQHIQECPVPFILDTATTILNTRWSQEYIFKQTPEYKELYFLKSVTQYLKIDTVAIKKIELLYKHLISKEMNNLEQGMPLTEKNLSPLSGEKKIMKEVLCEEDLSTTEKIIDLMQFKKNKKPKNAFQNKVVGYLEAIFFERHFLLFSNILKNKCSFVLTDFFNEDEIKQLIGNIKYA